MQVIYSDIEDEIVTWLAPIENGGGVDVVKLPQVQDEFQRPMMAGRVTVAYKSSGFGDVRSTHHITQDEKIQIELIVQARMLRGDNGIHKMVEAIKRRLVGFSPTDCSKMYLVSNGFIEHNNETALWTYSAIFECKYTVVEDFEFNTEPALQGVTFTYNIEDTVTVTPPVPGSVTIYNSIGELIGTEVPGGAFELPDEIIGVSVNGGATVQYAIPTLSTQQITITA